MRSMMMTLLACLVAAALVTGSHAISPGGQAVLNAHNNYRSRHRASPLSWDNGLERAAAAYASQCNFAHDPNNGRLGHGENIYVISSTNNPDKEMENAARSWYSEVRQYDFRRGDFSMATGHFTQMVWKGTTRLGCAAHVCSRGIRGFQRGTIVVCRYSPPGNMRGAFRQNVS